MSSQLELELKNFKRKFQKKTSEKVYGVGLRLAGTARQEYFFRSDIADDLSFNIGLLQGPILMYVHY